jgi:hypothetical protein
MTEEDRETMKKAELGMMGVFFVGLGATTIELGNGHRDLAAGIIIGTLVIDGVLGVIVMYEKFKEEIRPCTDFVSNFGIPSYLPRCHY